MMKPAISKSLLQTLRDSGQPPPWKCKLHLSRGRTIYAVEITAEGEIARVGTRPIYAESGIGFSPAVIEGVTLY